MVGGCDPITVVCSIKVNTPVTINTKIHFANDQPLSLSKDRCVHLKLQEHHSIAFKRGNALKNMDFLSLEISHVFMA